MDVSYPMLVVATADRHIQTFHLSNPTVPLKVSFVYPNLVDKKLQRVYLDHGISSKMADACGIVFPGGILRGQR
jgi:hypothetical protein